MVENVQESLPGGGSFSDPDPGYGGSSGGYDQGTIQVGKKILLYGIDSTGSTGSTKIIRFCPILIRQPPSKPVRNKLVHYNWA